MADMVHYKPVPGVDPGAHGVSNQGATADVEADVDQADEGASLWITQPESLSVDQGIKLDPDSKTKYRTDEEILVKVKRSSGELSAKEQRMYKTIMFLFIALNVIMAALNIMGWHTVMVEKDNRILVDDAPLCVACESLRQHPEDSLDHIKSFDNGTVCCADGTEHAGSLLAYYTEHWMKMNMIRENNTFGFCKNDQPSTPKASIKVVGLSTRQSEPGHYTLNWDAESSMAINALGNGSLEYREERIHIKKPGLYHVYSQIVFEHKNQQNADDSVLFTHKVVLHQSGDYSAVVMRSTESKCQTGLETHESSSYLSSMFQLKKGDSLSVQVYRTDDISPQPHMNSFGVHMM